MPFSVYFLYIFNTEWNWIFFFIATHNKYKKKCLNVCMCVCTASRCEESRRMVQPQPDGPMQWDMSGEESGGALRVPPELAANEVVTRLLGDNQQLRGTTTQ